MNIYLDTSHLQKWQQETLPITEVHTLNTLRDSGKHTFILSIAHIFDMTDREDGAKAIAIARFLDQLPQRWIRNAADLKREEIKNAIECFNNSISLIDPFLPDYVDTLEPEASSALGINLAYRGSSIEKIVTDLISTDISDRRGTLTKDKLYAWSHNNAFLISRLRNGGVKDKEMQKNLRRVFRDDINQFSLYDAIASTVITNKLIDSIRRSSKKGLVVLLGIPDVAKIRKKLMLSQRVFSEMYHINIETLKKWEQNKRTPDSVSRAYLKCIQGNPKLIFELVNK